jgi:hypothetical protein
MMMTIQAPLILPLTIQLTNGIMVMMMMEQELWSSGTTML